MSEDTVVVPVLSPEWLRKRERIFSGLAERTVRELEVPGSGLTLDQLQAVFEGRNPFEAARVLSLQDQLIAGATKKLRRHFGSASTVDQLPQAVTTENIRKWAKLNLVPVFLPGEEITESRNFRNWVKPEKWFYDQIRACNAANKLGLPLDSARLRRGWYLADFTVGVDYTDGTQVFVSDPLSALISNLRESGVVGKLNNTPSGSRFAITNDEWREKVLPTLTDELHGTGVTFRLERAVEFNAIGNCYDNNRGKFNMWQWFDDPFQDSRRLIGGPRGNGGLAFVSYDSASYRCDGFAGRPLGCFV